MIGEWGDHNNNNNIMKQQQQQVESEQIFYGRLEAARKALRHPFWDPHRHGTHSIPYSAIITSTTTPLSTILQSSHQGRSTMTTNCKFRQFVRFLASSCYTPHLRT
jgi:hypothetical protein